MSRGTPMFAFRFVPELRAKVTSICLARNMKRKKSKYSVSDFVRDAVAEKIAHLERSKQRLKVGARLKCCKCGDGVDHTNIAYQMQLLTGEIEYTCVPCDLLRPVSLIPPG